MGIDVDWHLVNLLEICSSIINLPIYVIICISICTDYTSKVFVLSNRFSWFYFYFDLVFISDDILVMYNYDFVLSWLILSPNFPSSFSRCAMSACRSSIGSASNAISRSRSKSRSPNPNVNNPNNPYLGLLIYFFYSNFHSNFILLFCVSMYFLIRKFITRRSSNTENNTALIRKNSVIPDSVIRDKLYNERQIIKIPTHVFLLSC